LNDWLEIEAAKDSSNSVVAAAKVVRIDAPSNNRTILQGPPDTATATPNIVILGVTGRTQTATTFEGASGGPLSQVSFFGQVTTNGIVKIRGQFTGQRIDPVDEAQLQD
jgi:hypothetical protein